MAAGTDETNSEERWLFSGDIVAHTVESIVALDTEWRFRTFYFTTLLICVAAIATIFVVKVDVSAMGAGLIRPAHGQDGDQFAAGWTGRRDRRKDKAARETRRPSDGPQHRIARSQSRKQSCRTGTRRARASRSGFPRTTAWRIQGAGFQGQFAACRRPNVFPVAKRSAPIWNRRKTFSFVPSRPARLRRASFSPRSMPRTT